MSRDYDQEHESERGNAQPMSVAEVCELQPGTPDNATWINAGFIGIVRKIDQRATKKGGKMWPCILSDTTGSAEVEMTLFTAPKFAVDDTIEVSGKGLRRTEFNGKAQVALGKATEVHVRDRGARRGAPAPAASSSRPPPPGGDERGTPPPADPAPGGGASSDKVAPYVNGQTIGMAMKEAIALTAKCWPAVDRALLDDPTFWAQVRDTTSDILRVSHWFAAGRLAPTARDRVAAAKAAKNAPPASPPPVTPPANRPAAKSAPADDLDEDVPF